MGGLMPLHGLKTVKYTPDILKLRKCDMQVDLCTPMGKKRGTL